jgi:hypothetical protein
MIFSKRTPYTYLIGWSKLNVWYYGRRTAINCHPDEFWISYFTSSKYVADFIKIHGDPDIKIIRRIFNNFNINDSITKCCRWEEKVVRRINAVKKTNWLNQHYAIAKWDTTGKISVKHIVTGETKLVDANDPDFINGILVGINHQIKHKTTSCVFCKNIFGINNIRVHEKTCQNNPQREYGALYGRKMTEDQCANMFGPRPAIAKDLNPNAKRWRLTTPNQEVIEFIGNLVEVIRENNLSPALLRKHMGSEVPKLDKRAVKANDVTRNTVGWKLEKIT